MKTGDTMENYLIPINREINEYYDNFFYHDKKADININESISKFSENVVALLDYYTEPIFNHGKKNITKYLNINKNEFSNEQMLFIKNYKNKTLTELQETLLLALTECFDLVDNKKKLINDVIEIISNKCINLFRYAQLSECINNNINQVYLVKTGNCCKVCNMKTNFKYDTNKLINSIDIFFHESCNISIKPAFIDENIFKSDVDQIINNLKIYIPHLIDEKQFIFVDDILKNDKFNETLSLTINDAKKLNDVKNKLEESPILYFETDNSILVSSHNYHKLEYIVTKSILVDKLKTFNIEWWKKEYSEKIKSKYIANGIVIYSNPFINYIAEDNYESYFIESAINYIINPKMLKDIDSNNYNQLKNEVFGEIEFLRSRFK